MKKIRDVKDIGFSVLSLAVLAFMTCVNVLTLADRVKNFGEEDTTSEQEEEKDAKCNKE